VVLARSAAAHRDLNTQFETRRVSKTYHAIVVGNPAWDDLAIDVPLRADGDRKHRTVIDPARGKAAVTNLHVLERFQQYTLIEAKPETGRTHQIRAHLAAQGFPIVADALYGNGQGIAGLDRLGLHARSLTIEHPVTREVMQFEAPYPEDFAAALRYLRGKSDAD
jgi:RluA family pseudouridine synthase